MSPAVQICDLISLICLNIKKKKKEKNTLIYHVPL